MPLGIDQGLGALVWSPLGWGRLTGKIRRGQPLPATSRLHKTTAEGPPVDDEYPLPRRRRHRCNRQRNRQVRSADRTQLAPAPPHRLQHHPRRPQRRAAQAKPRRLRLEPHSRTNRQTRRGQPDQPRLSLLAPARHQLPQSAPGLRDPCRSISKPEHAEWVPHPGCAWCWARSGWERRISPLRFIPTCTNAYTAHQ